MDLVKGLSYNLVTNIVHELGPIEYPCLSTPKGTVTRTISAVKTPLFVKTVHFVSGYKKRRSEILRALPLSSEGAFDLPDSNHCRCTECWIRHGYILYPNSTPQ